MSNIARYLQKIDNEHPLNLQAFTKHLITKGLHQYTLPPDVVALSGAKGKHIICISDHLRHEMQKLILPKDATRAQAAMSFQSHQVNVNGSLIVAKRIHENPYVVVINKDGKTTTNGVSNCKNLLIVENRDTFLIIDTIFNKLDITAPQDDLIVVLGNGNEICNRLHTQYLNTFETVYYFLDIYVGGLKIASTIKKLCHPHVAHHFLTPPALVNNMQVMSAMGKLTDTEKQAIYAISQREPFLVKACSLLLSAKHKAEQESFG
jgi:hypothetical protein